MSSDRHHFVSASPSYPPDGMVSMEDSSSNRSSKTSQWEEDYRRRARLMTRDYVNPNSTRLTHRRSRSADAVRPQYNTGTTTTTTTTANRTPTTKQGIYHPHAHQFQYQQQQQYQYNNESSAEFAATNHSSSGELSHHRDQCLNMFYPTIDESRARVMYDTQGPQFPSQLPRPVGIYQSTSDQERSGRSLSPARRSRYGGTSGGSNSGHSGSSSSYGRSRAARRTPSGMMDPYAAAMTSPQVRRSGGPSSSSQSFSRAPAPVTPIRHGYDYLRNSLIMFRDEEEESSMGTGLSQQELLERKRREQTTARRKEMKRRKRIVNLPSSLFPPHSNRHRQRQRAPQQDQYRVSSSSRNLEDLDDDDDFHEEAYEPPSPQLTTRQIPSTPLTPSSLDHRTYSDPGGATYERDTYSRVMVSPDPPAERSPESLQNTSMSSRGSMVNRIRNQKSSSGRRWKIIPSLSRSRSRSRSPVRKNRSAEEEEMDQTGAFPSPSRRVIASVRYGDPNKSVGNTSNDQSGNDQSHDDYPSNNTNNSPKRALDPPSQAIVVDDYSDDDEAEEASNTWNDISGQQPMLQEMNHDEDDNIYDQQPANFSNSSYSQEEHWDDDGRGVVESRSMEGQHYSHRIPIRNEFGDNRNEGGFPNGPQPRPHYESKGGLNTPHKQYGKERAFPEFASPTTPMTASMTNNDSNEMMSNEFDPFNTPIDVGSHEDLLGEDSPYTSRSQEITDLEEQFWRKQNKTRSANPLIPANFSENRQAANAQLHAAAYQPMSRLNNPPGLDMDFYSRPKPDAPATAVVTPNSKISPPAGTWDTNQNVRWSENLDQLPTPSRMTKEKPRSILRSSRLRRAVVRGIMDDPPDETPPSMTKSVRISNKPASRGQFISDHPSAMGFVDNNGEALSPIASFDAEYDDQDWPAAQIGAFERNIPEEFQQAFLNENLVTRTDANSGQMSAAYSDFIESVASVVVQTAARQFLAKLRVRKLREMRYASRDLSRKAWLQKNAALVRKKEILTPSYHGVKLDMFTLAAIRIQAVYRGWYARDCIAIDNYCATIIQKNFRRKLVSDLFSACVLCVVRIQSAFRSYRVRKALTRSVQGSSEIIYNMAAAIIQAQWRCFRCEMDFLRAYEDILLVQSIARGWVTRRRVRSWLRKNKIQTSLNSPARQDTSSSYGYTLPNGYHNHTAFMKQSLPSPVRSTHAAELQQQGAEETTSKKASYSSANSKEYPAISIDSSKDGLIEMYHKMQVQENPNDATPQEKSAAKSRTHQSGLSGEQTNQTRSGDVNVGSNARKAAFAQAQARVSRSYSHDATSARDREPAPLRSIQHKGQPVVGAKSFEPTPVHEGSFDLTAKHIPATVQSKTGRSFGNESEEVVDFRSDSNKGAVAEPQIDSSNLAKTSSVLAGWRSREKQGGSFDYDSTPANFNRVKDWSSPPRGNKTKSARPAVAYSGSFDLATKKPTKASSSQNQSVGLENAATMSEPTPAEDGAASEPNHVTASNVLAGWRNREKRGGSFDHRSTPAKVVHSGSFDLSASIPTQSAGSAETDNTATISESKPGVAGALSEANQATASNVLAGWRNREKKGGTTSAKVVSSGSFDVASMKPTHFAPSQGGSLVAASYASASEATPDDVVASKANHATASNVLAGWRNREKKGGTTSAKVVSSASFDIVSMKPTHSVPSQAGSVVAASSATASEPTPDDAMASEANHSSASNVIAGWRNREQKGGTTSAKVVSSASFDTASMKPTHSAPSQAGSVVATSSATASEPTRGDIAASEANIATASEPEPDDVGESNRATSSNVLAGWRNREKKGGSFDHGSTSTNMHRSESSSSRSSVNMPTWLINKGTGAEVKPDGVDVKRSSAHKPSWKQNRSGISLSKSHDELHARPRGVDKPTEDHSPESSNNYERFGMKQGSMSHDLYDEKKEDSAVLSFATRKVDATQCQVLPPSIQPDHKADLTCTGPAKVSAERRSEVTVSEGISVQEYSRPSGDPLKSKSSIHMEMRSKRSPSEQQRIDAMHHAFIRAGLMGRVEKEKISFANTTSAEYEGKKIQQEDNDYEPTASDLLHAWKGLDQTQPAMRGKLF